ncbi:MAG: hypothetical protein OXC05_14830 [Halieaceae bacterium]|nr:hypothetical protein [Halieaceae bacterium]
MGIRSVTDLPTCLNLLHPLGILGAKRGGETGHPSFQDKSEKQSVPPIDVGVPYCLGVTMPLDLGSGNLARLRQ